MPLEPVSPPSDPPALLPAPPPPPAEEAPLSGRLLHSVKGYYVGYEGSGPLEILEDILRAAEQPRIGKIMMGFVHGR